MVKLMTKIRISILGCTGKTGKKILYHASHNNNFELQNCLVSSSNKFLHQDLSLVIDKKEKINAIATDNLDEIITNSDFIIDFSTSEVTSQLFHRDFKNKKIILGVTNISDKLQSQIHQKSQENIIFQSANMSIGVALINHFLKTNREILNSQYDTIINDIHHKNKKDSPSGTALSFKENLRKDKNIDIHSSRIGDINGIHEILMINENEIIKISHEALNRDIFAIGALKIASWLYHINEKGLYNMENFLKNFRTSNNQN
jgi:4-hydroxy-tetrahydrodipicolinate reductase